MMDLHQIQITYQAEEDRLLCRTSFKAADGSLQEVRAWLTRRLTRRLWSATIDALETQVGLDKPHASHASADIVGMEHHAHVEEIRDSGSFNAPYRSDIGSYPLGEAPILVADVNFTLNPGLPIRMNLAPTQGYGIELAFTLSVLHGFCSLLREAALKSDWDLELSMPGTTAPDRTRMLN